MPKQAIIDSLTEILRGLLADDSLELSEESTRSDFPQWDSFTYVNFIVAAEMQFSVRFGVAEVESFRTVGEIATRIMELSEE